MTLWHWIIIGAFPVGLLAGPSALSAASAAQPPIQWADLPFVFFGSAFGMFFVVGMQIVRRDPKYARFVYRFMVPISVWFAASGLSAIALTAFRAEFTPATLFILSAGAGALLGLALFWLTFRRRYGVAP